MRVFTVRGTLNLIKCVLTTNINSLSECEGKMYNLLQLVRKQQGLQRVCLQDNRRIITGLFIHCSYVVYLFTFRTVTNTKILKNTMKCYERTPNPYLCFLAELRRPEGPPSSPITIGTGSHACIEIETHATFFSW